MRIWGLLKTTAAAGALLAVSACTVHQAEEGPVNFGPSDFATAIGLTITPDTVTLDGASQASVLVTAHDANGQPKSGVVVRLDQVLNGSIQDVGRLSARTVVTGTDGRATAVFTSPLLTPLALSQIGGDGLIMNIIAVPSGSNFDAATARNVSLRLVPPGVLLPPAETPTAAFRVSAPTSVAASITFDASSSCAGSVDPAGTCLSTGFISTYAWSFGDGSSGSGRLAIHSYSVAGTYAATLTVTNDRGLSASTTQNVSVAAVAAPTGDWVISPTSPNVNETVFFNADAVRPAAGHTVSSYSWDFGDGTTGSGGQASHVYTAARTYTVVLTVTDDTGNRSVFPKTVSIGSGAPNAVLNVTKTGFGNEIRADGGSSSASGGATISNYAFDYGSCTPVPPGGQSSSSSFATVTCVDGTHTIRLIVTDSLGRSSSATPQTVKFP